MADDYGNLVPPPVSAQPVGSSKKGPLGKHLETWMKDLTSKTGGGEGKNEGSGEAD